MPSKSHTNMIAALSSAGFAAGVAEKLYRNRERNSTVLAITKRIYRRIVAARVLWQSNTKEDTALIGRELKVLDARVRARRIDLVELTSTAYGMLEVVHLALLEKNERMEKSRRGVRPFERKRARAIEMLMNSVNELHRHFDRRLDRDDAYEEAIQTLRAWEEREQIMKLPETRGSYINRMRMVLC